MREGELLGLVLELKLRISAYDGEAQQRGDGVREVGNPFFAQVAPSLVTARKRADFFGVWCDIDVLRRQGADERAKLADRVSDGRNIRSAGENLELFQAQTEQARGQWFRNRTSASVLIDLEIIEVVPVIDDQEVSLLLTVGRVRPRAGAAAKHLPELHLTEDGLGKDEIPNGGYVDAGIEHVHRDGDAGEVLVLEIIEGFLCPLHLAVDDFGETLALKVGVKTVEAFVDFQGVPVRHSKDDGLRGQGASGVVDRMVHELADDSVVGTGIRDLALQVCALEAVLVGVDSLLANLLFYFIRKLSRLQPFDLKTSAGDVNRTIRNKVFVPHRFIVTVVKRRAVVVTVEQLEGVVIEEVGGRGGEAEMDCVEVVEDGLVAAVDGAMAFVRNDEVVVARGEPLVD